MGFVMCAQRPAEMTDRERFVAHMHYQPVDRCPLWDFGFLDVTLQHWQQQGLPPGADTDVLFGMDQQWRFCTPNILLEPAFEEKVLEDRGDRELLQLEDGARVVKLKGVMSMPTWVSYPVNDRSDWQRFKRRLDPDTPGRIPDDWQERCRRHVDRDYPLLLKAGGLYGHPRNWMGLEALSKSLYRDETLFLEMVGTLAQLITTVLSRALEQARAVGLTFDAASMWEDMCYKAGPLISPRMVRRYMLPHYRTITRVLHEHGIDVIFLDCDGEIDALIDIWLEAGINCMFPVEVGTWQADPVEFRRRYGKQLLMMGGFDKRILARGPGPIDAEIDRLAPVVEEGGFIPFCDHRVPPDVPLRHYVHYVERAKQVWGRGENVRPTWHPDDPRDGR